MMVPDDHDAVVAQPLLKKEVIGKLLEVAAPHSRGIKVVALRVGLDEIYSLVKIAPEPLVKIFRNLPIPLPNLTGILSSPGMNNQLHVREVLFASDSTKLISRDSLHLTAVHLSPALCNFLIINPVMSPFEAAEQIDGKFRPLWVGEIVRSITNFGNFDHLADSTL